MKGFKGKREVISVNYWDRESELSPISHPALHASPSSSRGPSLDAILVPWFVLEITEGKFSGSESGQLLITFSSFLFLDL